MDEMIAYCGLVCTECEAYLATQTGDWNALEAMAAKARAEYGVADATAESVQCDGCLSTSNRLCGYCSVCEVRACASQRGLDNCAYCDEYGCGKIEAFFAMAPNARTTLDGIRARLAA